MKVSAKLSVVAAGVLGSLVLASAPTMAAEAVSPYVHATDGSIVRVVDNSCLRTGFWTPALAEASGEAKICDPGLAPAPAPQEPAPVAPPPAPEKAAEKVTLSADTLFDFGRASLKPEGKKAIDELVSRIAGLDIEVILSTGYSDRIGNDKLNQRLSLKRAQAVKSYMVSKGISAKLINAEGKGEADPVVDCPNPSPKSNIKNFKELVKCLAPNRRAVIEVIGTRPAE